MLSSLLIVVTIILIVTCVFILNAYSQTLLVGILLFSAEGF